MKRKTILLIEDEEARHQVHAISFELEGFDVMSVKDQTQEMDFISELSLDYLPGCIVIDHHQELKFLKAIAKDPVLSKIPVIVCTLPGRFLQGEFKVEIVEKPVKIEFLKTLLDRIIPAE